MSLEARIERLEREVETLGAIEALRRALSEYAVGVDEAKPAVLAEIFAADAVLEIPAWDIELGGRDAILEFFETYWGTFSNPRRYTANERFDIEGDSATAFMYWQVTQERDGASVLAWGTYDWGFRRNQDRWQIVREVVHIHTMTTLDEGWAGRAQVMQLN